MDLIWTPKVLSSIGLGLDVVGAFLIAFNVFNDFKGTKFVLGQTYGTFLNPPTETAEFKAWSKRNFIFACFGLLLLFGGFGFQVLALLIQVKSQ